jgi:isoamylase
VGLLSLQSPEGDLFGPPNHHVLIMMHAGSEPRRFTVPRIARSYSWWTLVNTGVPAPKDIYPDLDGPSPPPDWTIELEGRSLACYVAKDDH